MDSGEILKGSEKYLLLPSWKINNFVAVFFHLLTMSYPEWSQNDLVRCSRFRHSQQWTLITDNKDYKSIRAVTSSGPCTPLAAEWVLSYFVCKYSQLLMVTSLFSSFVFQDTKCIFSHSKPESGCEREWWPPAPGGEKKKNTYSELVFS